MELVRSAIEAPRLMFKVPLVLRSLAMEEVKAVSRSAKTWDPMVLKLAMLAAAYVSEAARFPREMTEKISGVLVERISRAVDRRSSAAKERHAVAETSDDVAKAVSVLASINGLYAPNRTPGSLQALGTHGVYRKGVRFKTPDGDQARSRALIGLLGVAAQQGGFAVIQADDSIAIGIGPRPPAPSDLRLADSGDTQERLAVVVCSNGDIAMRITDGQSVDAEGWIDTSAAEPIDSLHTLSLAAGRGLEAILEMANPPRISDRA